MVFHLNEVNMKFLGILRWHILSVFLIEGLLVQEITLTTGLKREESAGTINWGKISAPDGLSNLHVLHKKHTKKKPGGRYSSF